MSKTLQSYYGSKKSTVIIRMTDHTWLFIIFFEKKNFFFLFWNLLTSNMQFSLNYESVGNKIN